MNVILTTCKDRRQHLGPALRSWRQWLPDWAPLLVAVEDPLAVDMLARAYVGRPWSSVSITQPRFSKLLAQKAGMAKLGESAGVVANLDADVIAIPMTASMLAGVPARSFVIADHRRDGSDFCDDMGQLIAPADVLRDAFALIGDDVGDWWGYGWDDIAVRCACWLVTEGNCIRRRALWAHIPNSAAEHTVGFGGEIREHTQRNAPLLVRLLDRMASECGVSDWRRSGLREMFWRPGPGREFLPA